MPQPYFVPFRLSSSRKTHSRGVSAATSTVMDFPLTLSVYGMGTWTPAYGTLDPNHGGKSSTEATETTEPTEATEAVEPSSYKTSIQTERGLARIARIAQMTVTLRAESRCPPSA